MQRTHGIRIPQSIVEVTAQQCPLEQSLKKTLVTLQWLSCTKTCSIKIKKQTCLLHSSQGQKTPEIEAQVVVTLPLQALEPSGLSAIAM
jgi:hypothetical protein